MPVPHLNSPLPAATFVVVDVETTGLDAAKGARVVELGALKLAGGRPVDHLLTLVDPGVPIPADATAVHGLTDADVAGQPPLADVLPAFYDFLGDAVLVAHNLKFDLSFLARGAREAGLPPLANAAVDLLGLARTCRPGLAAYNLEALTAHLGLVNPAPHRSLGDVAVESEVLLTFLGEVAAARPGATVGDVVMLSRELEPTPAVAPAVILALEWALAAGDDVEIIYLGDEGESRRRISPRRVVARAGTLVVKAFCHERGAAREFRLDRVSFPGDTP